MLSADIARCQGAPARFVRNPIQLGALPADCCDCTRRTHIVPGYAHSYQTPPTWLPGMECPRRISPAAVLVVEDDE